MAGGGAGEFVRRTVMLLLGLWMNRGLAPGSFPQEDFGPRAKQIDEYHKRTTGLRRIKNIANKKYFGGIFLSFFVVFLDFLV